MESKRIQPRLTVREQLNARPNIGGHRFRDRQLALDIKGPVGFGRRAADVFVDGKFDPPLEIKDYNIKLFTPNGIELNVQNLVGKSASEIDARAARIDEISQIVQVKTEADMRREDLLWIDQCLAARRNDTSQESIASKVQEIGHQAAVVEVALPVRRTALAEEIGIEMMPILAGEFVAWNPRQRTEHNAFQIAKTPFTNGQFKALYEKKPEEVKEIIGNPLYIENYNKLDVPFDPNSLLSHSLALSVEEDADKKEESPLVLISQMQAAKIAELLGMRLPTELECMRAALSADKRMYRLRGELYGLRIKRCDDNRTMSVFRNPELVSPEGILILELNLSEHTSSLRGEIEWMKHTDNRSGGRTASGKQSHKDMYYGAIRCGWNSFCKFPSVELSKIMSKGFTTYLGFRFAEDLR